MLSPLPQRTFEGLVVGTGVQDRCSRAVAAAVRSLLTGLAAAGVEVVEAAEDDPAGIGRARRVLADCGITGELVLAVCGCGCGHSPTGFTGWTVACVGGPDHRPTAGVVHLGPADQLVAALERQADRHRAGRVPHVDPDPRWSVALPSDPLDGPLAESLGALSNGWAGARATLEEGGAGRSAPPFLVAGVYDRGDRLLPGPAWTAVDLPAADAGSRPVRVLDLRCGLLERRPTAAGRIRSVRLVSAADPHALALRCETEGGAPGGGDLLRPPPGRPGFTRRRFPDRSETAVSADPGGAEIAVAARESRGEDAGWATLERLAAWASGPPGGPAGQQARERLAALERAGFDRVLHDHRRAWAGRWRRAAVSIEGPAADELAARFAVFHLLGAAGDSGESAVGPRGVTGGAYGGHVFWDADVFVLPALAAIRPAAARSMLEYRLRRLPAARRAAQASGGDGARFPWESAGDGTDVTPAWVRGPSGTVAPVATGRNELHIVADVAWAAVRYARWTGDQRLLSDRPGRDLLEQTARFWASRIRMDGSGRGHLDGVMGPDEYHDEVDDNAFTNAIAAWNLRAAADLVTAAESDRWRALADGLADGWDPGRRTFEQFAGYFDLEGLVVSDVARPPVAVDLVMGHDRVSGSQLIKQPDVLMIHHMLPDQAPDGSLGPSLDFYGPRTAHGSSLSPAVHASLLARAGRTAEALEMYRLAGRLDLDDVTGTSASGLHLATMGGLWQALAYGFLGLRADEGALAVDPHLPEEWSALTMSMTFRSATLEIRADREGVAVGCDRPVRMRPGGGPVQLIRPPGSRLGSPGP